MSGRRGASAGRDFTGRVLGVYVVRGRLGAGAMGDVYRARDTRLGRDVALKVLPESLAADPDRVRRFEKEARAASALSHPNIVTVYEVGTAEAVSYIAMELVDGKTLRDALASGPMPVKRLLDLAVQIADGLARAHEAGIVHRDLKPENLMVSKDGFAKILDFGLAKRLPFENSGASGMSTLTDAGFIVGTVGYMSPEQASGRPVDFRSDQFALGAILYELISGRRAFDQPSKGEALAAIIRDEPDGAALAASGVPVPLRWIVERCLAKDPGERYGCTADLAAELGTVRDRWTELPGAPVEEGRRSARPGLLAGLAAATVLAGVAAVFFATRRPPAPPSPDFQRMTFRSGVVPAARFAPDGRTIVYSGEFDRGPARIFTARTDGQESSRLALPDGAALQSVSSLGEVALTIGGTLARVPLAGGAPREMVEGVSGADWSPDGKTLAIVRSVAGKNRLEFPIGKVLLETASLIRSPRVSPDGGRVAFLVENAIDSNATVEIVDRAGTRRRLSGPWKRVHAVAWSPDGREVWFGANERGLRWPIYAVDAKGNVRLVLRLPSVLELEDIAPDGRALVRIVAMRSTIRALTPNEPEEHDLTWHEMSFAKSITPDGKTLLFDEGGEGNFHAIYVRPTDGSPAKLLGDGRSLAISPDGRWAASSASGIGSPVVLLPTGAGENRTLDDGRHRFEEAVFLPDSRQLLASGTAGSWLLDVEGGKQTAVGGRGFACSAVSPDGREAACVEPGGRGVLCPLAGGDCRPIPGFSNGSEGVFQWSGDGRSLYVGEVNTDPLRVYRLDLPNGRRELWHEFKPSDGPGNPYGITYFAMTPDGKYYAYSSWNAQSDLYLVTGLK